MSASPVAIHEAGHAVAAIAFGVPLEHVTIVPEGTALGHALVVLGGGSPRSEAIVKLAGSAAEERFAGVMRQVTDKDTAMAAAGLRKIAPGWVYRERLMKMAEADVQAFLRTAEYGIRQVAKALDRFKTLTGDEVRRIVYLSEVPIRCGRRT